ncbi:hypothetical protein [Cryobacterium gelidum]|uniref:hypothetical protein n=1 Tax=Cryobacterium gelidum TaxID=1259164 RepID=UPI00141B48FD|nr:hypothetical protein [Cryobacterium gelidum]
MRDADCVDRAHPGSRRVGECNASIRVQDEVVMVDALRRALTAEGFLATVEHRSDGQTVADIVVRLSLAPGGVTHLEM